MSSPAPVAPNARHPERSEGSALDDKQIKKRLRSPKPLGRLLPRLRPYRLRLALAAVCLVIAASVGLVFPLVVRYLLDAAFQAKDSVLLNRIALGLLAAFALQGIMNFA